MFINDLIFGKKDKKSRQTIQTFKQVPRQELAEYNLNKGRVRYESGYKDSEGFQIAKNQFQRFVNNKPIEVLSASNAKKDMMFENVGKIAKKVLISEYEVLCRKFQNSSALYSDPDFKPCDASLGPTYVRPGNTWKRITQIIPDAEFISDTISPEDIIQGTLGNCYFLSAVSALAESDFRIKNIFPKLQINKNGFYMARVLHLGVLQQVVVDDYIPVDKYGKPLFAKPAGGKQIWVMILEKCWAKLFGSYEIVEAGLPREALYAFSGAPTFYNSIPSKRSEQDQLFDSLFEANAEGAVMCCGSKSDNKVVQKGLVQAHAYTILEIYEQPYKMVKLRNPWGSKEWNGRASQQDQQFWNRMKAFDRDKLGQKFANDGIFFMLWEDFVNYFTMIDVCKINDNANYFYYEDEYKTDVPRLFELQVSGGEVVISAAQLNLRSVHWKDKLKKGYGTVTLILSRRIQGENGADLEYVESIKENSFPECHLVFKNLEAGKYVIFVSIQWTRSNKDSATVSVYTDCQIKLVDSQLNSQEFLYKTYLSHARKNTEKTQVILKNPQIKYCSQILPQKCGYGYIVVRLDESSGRNFSMQIIEDLYTETNLQLLPPYKGKGKFKVIVEPGREVIILLRLIPGNYYGQFSIPEPQNFNFV